MSCFYGLFCQKPCRVLTLLVREISDLHNHIFLRWLVESSFDSTPLTAHKQYERGMQTIEEITTYFSGVLVIGENIGIRDGSVHSTGPIWMR